MTNKSKIIIASLMIVSAYAFGRWSAPEKIKIETKTVEVEKKSKDTTTDAERNKHKETKTVEVTNPDGTKTTTTTVIEDSSVDKRTASQEKSDKNTTSTSTKEVTKSHSRLTISALAGIPLSLDGAPVIPVYGGHIQKEVLGPVSIGVWALSNRTAGASVGLSF